MKHALHFLRRQVITKYHVLLFLSVLSVNISAQQWTRSFYPHTRYTSQFWFVDSTHIVEVGGSESNAPLEDIFKSNTTGLTWDFSWNQGSNWFKSVVFMDTLRGIAIGYNGVMVKTTDGGTSWHQDSVPTQRHLHRIVKLNNHTLIIVGGRRSNGDTLQTIYRSTDTGRTWSTVFDRYGIWLRSVAFADSLHGVAVGDSGTIFKTIDGGLNWNSVSSGVLNDLWDVVFVNTNTGFAVGGSGIYFSNPNHVILKTTNGGGSWSILQNSNGAGYRAVNFLNDSVGYVVGDSAIFLKTRDRGVTWTKQTLPVFLSTEQFRAVHFYNENYGMVGGLFGWAYIYSNAPLAQAKAIAATVDSTTATISAAVNTHGAYATYKFYYTTDSTFNSYFTSYPGIFQSASLVPLDLQLDNLLPDTTYYFFVEVTTLGGTITSDTIKFRTTSQHYFFHTLPASNVAISSAKINGTVHQFPTSVNLAFEYGLSPLLGLQTAATPSNINDTSLYSIYASLSSLLPDTTYYFRLKGTSNGKTYYGEIRSFYTSATPYSLLKTDSAGSVTDTTAVLYGSLNDFRLLPASLSFIYGKTITMNKEVPANPGYIVDQSYHQITANVSPLEPNTRYYFCLKAHAGNIDYFADTISFVTSVQYNKFNTLPAVVTSNTTAQLNGFVQRYLVSLNLSFDWGTTPSLGNTAAAVPSSVNDTLLHDVTGSLTGLTPGVMYYYRLRGIHGTDTVLGELKQFYAGASDIPNWDFQFWQSDTLNIPYGWNLFNKTFERVPGHTGNYALKLTGATFAINGFIGDGLFGGVPITVSQRPDSIAFWLNYDIAVGDTGLLVIVFKKNSVPLVNDFSKVFYIITGNSGGVFKRLAYKIQYDTLLVPDSAIIGFAPVNFFAGHFISLNNTITIDDITLSPGNTGFGANDFEKWFTSYVESPDGWFNFRYFGLDTSDPTANHMVSKVYFNPPNDYAAKISCFYWPQADAVLNGELSTHPGIPIGGAGGFPITAKHLSLNGYYKYLPNADDTGLIDVAVQKNGMQIGFGQMYLHDSVPDFTSFTIPINYSVDAIPDSADILFRCSIKHPPHNKTTLIVDKLSFDNFITDVKNPKNEEFNAEGIKIYPNPSRDFIVIENNFSGNEDAELILYSISGEIISEIKISSAQKNTQIPVNNLSRGMYMISVKKGDQIFTKKILIQ